MAILSFRPVFAIGQNDLSCGRHEYCNDPMFDDQITFCVPFLRRLATCRISNTVIRETVKHLVNCFFFHFPLFLSKVCLEHTAPLSLPENLLHVNKFLKKHLLTPQFS